MLLCSPLTERKRHGRRSELGLSGDGRVLVVHLGLVDALGGFSHGLDADREREKYAQSKTVSGTSMSR